MRIREALESHNHIHETTVALVEPEYSINVGYVARAMANFGLWHLVLVGESKFNKEEATKFSSHASPIIKHIKTTPSVTHLRKQFPLLVGTTAIKSKRKSNLLRKTLDPSACAEAISQNFPGIKERSGKGMCLLFGRDTTGLTNEELSECDFTLTISTGTAYNTMNVSHAVAVILYVFKEAFDVKVKRRSIRELTDGQTSQTDTKERERVVSLFVKLASYSDFQEYKTQNLRLALERLLARSNPSLRELYLLMGLASKISSKIQRMSKSVDGENI